MPTDQKGRFLSRRHSTLVIVAHQDDETVGCSFLLQGHTSVHVSFCTDGGAPPSVPVWRRIGLNSRGEYVSLRQREALAAVKISGAAAECEFHLKEDGRLFTALEATYNELRYTVDRVGPAFILTHAFEGGHPDHDCCSFLGHHLSQEFGIACWEMPIYGRGVEGPLIQTFDSITGDVAQLQPDDEVVKTKSAMFQAHKSQQRLGNLTMFDPRRPEVYRPQPLRDYSKAISAFSSYLVATATPQEMGAAFERFRC